MSLEKEKNLHLLATQEYMVSWKADGLRYMILIESQNQVYAFDRDNNPFNIPRIVFPRSQVDERQIGSDHLRDTLLDAEMVMDRLQKPDRTFEEIPRLLIYDIVTWQVLYSLLSRI